MSSTSDIVTVDQLPLQFQAKYMGMEPARGLWGIKHTRKPVDSLVQAARKLPANKILPMVTVTVSTQGITVEMIPMSKKEKSTPKIIAYNIDQISYGVQDMIYTRVFSMIVVKDLKSTHSDSTTTPFECHAFVCDSRYTVRKLTYALAAAFQEYSKSMKDDDKEMNPKKKYAIDLRTPEELEAEGADETEA